MTFSIAGKTAIVTGAASGCGLAIGRHFLEEGANVIFADQDEERLRSELSDDVGDDTPARLFAGDISEKLTIANLLSATIDAFEGVDILVNAARTIEMSDPLEANEDHVQNLFQRNVMTSLRMTQAVAKRMIKQGEDQEQEKGSLGSIVNISSIAGRRTHANLLAYSMAMAAMDQMTRSMAVALADQRVRVNAVSFGSVMSASLRDALREDADARDHILEATPLGRIAGAGAVSDAAQYLASDASGFVTGQVITVDGGRTLLDPAGMVAH